jgi:hypothetical protein
MFCSSSALDARRIFLSWARATVPFWRCLVGSTAYELPAEAGDEDDVANVTAKLRGPEARQ